MKSTFRILALSLLPIGLAIAEDSHVEGEVLVTFKESITANRVENSLGRQALRMTRRFDRFTGRGRGSVGLVRGKSHSTAQLIAMLKADPDVASVEPNYIRRLNGIVPDDTSFPILWGLENTGQTVNSTVGTSGVDTRFSPAWRLARSGGGEIVIGIIDSGVDIDHPDLAANLWTHPGEIPGNGIDDDGDGRIDDLHGFDFASSTARITDSGSHGTHVAGTAAAVGRNGNGVIGTGFRAKILPMKASNDGINIVTSAALAAYDHAITLKQQGVNIVALNASFSGTSFSFSELTAITALRDAGIILCAAAGNDAKNNDITPSYPAGYNVSNIISVAAVDQNGALAAFSNFGATSVDLAAPGVNIFSTRPLDDFAFTTSVTVNATTYASQQLQFTGAVTQPGLSKTVVACGVGNPGQFPPAVSGNIALIQRGTITFAAKVANAMQAGAVAAIIYDNTADDLIVGSWGLDATRNWIPALRVTQASGQAILAQLPVSGTVINGPAAAVPYQFLNGTSMAAPHVTGALAFAALNFPAETMAQRIARILGSVTPLPALAGKTVTGGSLNLLRIVDTDTDGLPDWWETDHFGNLTQTATGNPDGDSFPNLDEFLTGTSPVNAASQLAFSVAAPGPGNGFHLGFPSILDSSYKIEWSENLTSWSPLASPVPGTGGEIQITDPDALGQDAKRFYRISLLPQ
ncbi:MAG: S8 family serine peptidase [Verrucomicrobiota bacterium]